MPSPGKPGATHRVQEALLPDLRARWIKLAGAREAVQAAAQAMQRIEAAYQDTLNTALRLQGLDPATNWKINLETGEIAEVTAADVAQPIDYGTGTPFVAPTPDASN